MPLDKPPVHEGSSTSVLARTIRSCAVDELALAALMRDHTEKPHCHLCEELIAGEIFGAGLLLWTRGEEVRVEEPPLCFECATSIGVTALARWAHEEEELD